MSFLYNQLYKEHVVCWQPNVLYCDSPLPGETLRDFYLMVTDQFGRLCVEHLWRTKEFVRKHTEKERWQEGVWRTEKQVQAISVGQHSTGVQW